MSFPKEIGHFSPVDQEKICAVYYGHKAVGESIRHDDKNKPGSFQPRWIRADSGCYGCDVWESYAVGFLAGSLISSGGRNSGEAVVGLAIVALALSSVASFFASIYQTVRGATLKHKAAEGKIAQARVNDPASPLDAATKQNIDAIYRRATNVNSRIANKKFAYAAGAFVLGGGLALLTTVAIIFFRQHNFSWALLAPGLALTGAGAVGLSAIALSKRAWLPRDRNHQLAVAIRTLIENNQELFDAALLLKLEVLKLKPVLIPQATVYHYHGRTDFYSQGYALAPDYRT